MSTVLLRTLKRLVSLETESTEELVEVEFLSKKTGVPDLELSVYEIEDAAAVVTQARTEHQASFLDPPRDRLAAVSLSGFSDIDLVEEEGGTRFAFTRAAHRSLQLFDAEEVSRVARAVIEERVARRRITDLEDARSFVRERLALGDAEWRALCEDKKRRAWATWARENPAQTRLPTGTTAHTQALTNASEPRVSPGDEGRQPPTTGGQSSPSETERVVHAEREALSRQQAHHLATAAAHPDAPSDEKASPSTEESPTPPRSRARRSSKPRV